MVSQRGLVTICLVAVGAGILTGLVGGAFRWCLMTADAWRVDLVEWTQQLPGPGWLVPMAVTATGATLAALIVRWVPPAAGSGIQRVEAVEQGQIEPTGPLLLPAKFLGGVLAIGSGLVLGREGPTVHMGAAIGVEASRRVRLDDADIRTMQTALGGAGLAVAFNAPIGGTLFALEEVSKGFRLRIVLAAVFATIAAVGSSRFIIDDHPDFLVKPLDVQPFSLVPVFVVFGLLTGLLGCLYSRLVLSFLDRAGRMRRIPPVARAAVVGAVIGLALAVDPHTVGGGDPLTQLLLDGRPFVVPVLIAYLVVRFLAGPLSYSTGVPGGLFAPLLAIGALWGVLCATAVAAVLPVDPGTLTITMAIVGMGAFFAAVVRAPLTAVVLVLEMTAAVAVVIPMLAAAATAVLVAELLRSEPIYDSLRKRM